MSKIGQWFYDLQQEHSEGKCQKKCQFCDEERNMSPHYEYAETNEEILI